MKTTAILSICFAASALATPLVARKAAQTIEVEYYPSAGCKTGGKTVSVVTGTKCYNTAFTADSFKVAGTTKLPNGCTLKGFAGANCGSFEEQYIDGPSLGQCGTNNDGKFKSIQINCD